MSIFSGRLRLVVACFLTFSGAACKSTEKQPDKVSAPAPSATGRAQVAPVSAAAIAEANNPTGQPLYSGATGSVSGVVRLTGDPVPELAQLKKSLPLGKCLSAHKVHGVLVREGANRVVADVLVAVTEYSGYLGAKAMSKTLEVKDCAFSQRTVALTFGQTLKIKNHGPAAVTPQLMGSPARALMVAVPGGQPLSMFPHKPGRYQLIDRSHSFATAEVYVLSYPTADVTDTAGKFAIQGIPVGSATLSAFLPQTGQTLSKKIEVKAGEDLSIELELAFDKTKHVPKSAAQDPQP